MAIAAALTTGMVYLRRLVAGAGTETFLPSGVIHVDTTQAATGANTDATTLFTYTLPANTLNANGRGIRVTMFGSFAANANGKTITGTFGGTNVVSDNGNHNGGGWKITMDIIRTAAGAQIAIGETLMLRTKLGTLTALTKDETGALTITMVATNGTANANDIVFRGAIVEMLMG